MCVGVYVFEGDYVHVGDKGGVWWWKSGLTGLTSLWLSVFCLLFLCLFFSIFLFIYSVVRHTAFLEVWTFKARADKTMETETWREFPSLQQMCMSRMLKGKLGDMFDLVFIKVQFWKYVKFNKLLFLILYFHTSLLFLSCANLLENTIFPHKTLESQGWSDLAFNYNTTT